MAILVFCCLQKANRGHCAVVNRCPKVNQVVLVVRPVGPAYHCNGGRWQVVWICSRVVVLEWLVVRAVISYGRVGNVDVRGLADCGAINDARRLEASLEPAPRYS